MLSLALTGNVASGKSAVAGLLASWGAVVLDADAMVHALQRAGTPVFDAIVGAFGEEVVGADGQLDRAALRHRITASPADRAALEAIVHPAVEAERQRRLAEARAAGASVVVSDIPLLFEAGNPAAFDGVILVEAPEAVRRERLVTRRGFDPSAAEALMGLQLPSEAKRAQSDWIILNHGTLADLEARTREAWEAILARAAEAS